MRLMEFASRLQTMIGAKSLSVDAAIFCFEGRPDYTNPNGLTLNFEGGVAHAVRGASDGFSLLLTDEPLEALDMDDAGKVVIKSLSKMPIWSRVIGSRLSKVVLYADQMQRKPFGIHMEFGVAAVGIWNFGDDLYVYDALPVEALSGEPHFTVELP